MSEWWDGIKADFVLNFIKEDRWMLLATGLGNTLKITFVALIIGILLGLSLIHISEPTRH